MLLVDSIFVDEAIPPARFCCDLQACKGVCCTLEGGRGAPVEDAEVPLLLESISAASAYLRPESLAALAQMGPLEGSPGDFATTCMDHRECVFVYFDEGIARCSFERAHREGRISWPKPVSCHLFPIRVRSFGQHVARYEQIEECEAGRSHGQTRDVALVDFLKDALIRKFGEGWYAQLHGQNTTLTGTR
jgi:hypothetical protein